MKKSFVTEKLTAVIVMCALGAANIAFVESGMWKLGQGAPVNISGMDSGIYQVSELRQQKDGSLVVQASAAGFQSDIQVAVIFDSTGTVIQEMKVVSQGETDGIGSKVTESSYTSQFAQLTAPVGLNGTDYVVVSPVTGEAYGISDAAAGEMRESALNAENMNSVSWNLENQSGNSMYDADLTAEGQSMEKMRQAGLTSRTDGVAVADLSAEGQSMEKLRQAGLTSRTDGVAAADLSAEARSMRKMEQAGLLELNVQESQTASLESPVQTAMVDAVSGATISSTAAVTAVNNAYFFLQDYIAE